MTVHFQDIPEAARAAITSPVGNAAPAEGIYRRSFKRFFDTALVLVTLPIVLPIILVFAALVALDGHNPFYTQKRVGRNGRIFRIFKLRSMVPNADDLLAAHIASDAEARAEWQSTQKLKKDPRITRIGAFIRRSSIDELPQFFNVLLGHMSLVGPRPMLIEQVPLYPGSAYYRLRPGITGFWQISDRNECAFADRALHDARYEAKISLGTDLGILASTIGVVLRCTGY